MNIVVLLAAAAIVLLGGAAGGDAARYDLPRGWTCNNTLDNLSELAIAGGPGRYRVLKINASTAIQSENATFALAFLDLTGHGDFYLSVIMQQRPAAAAEATIMPVWVSNQSGAIGDGGFLMLTSRTGKLILLDNKRSISGPLWTIVKTGVTAVELQETGNLIFYGDDGGSTPTTGVLWQSFDDPTDVLLPQQELKTGMVLTSRTNGSSLAAGMYRAEMRAGGLVLTLSPPLLASDSSLSSPPPAQPYLVWSLGHGNGLQSAAQRCGSGGAVLVYDGSSLKLSHGDESLPCSNSSSIPVGGSSESRVDFFKLTPNGDLVSFTSGPEGRGWEPGGGFSLSRARSGSSCSLPLFCGAYGICQTGARCRCLVVSSPGNESFGGESASCNTTGVPKGATHRELCENEEENHHMLDSSDTAYFSTALVEPDITSTSLDLCKQTCLWNCSCSAAFFDTNNGRCFFVAGALVGSLSIRPGMVASLKFRNAMLLTGPVAAGEANKGGKVRLVVAALSSVAVVLLAFLVVILWRNRISRRRRRLRDISRHEDSCEVEQVLNSARGLPQRFSYASLDTATEGFSHKLGAGGFGSVYEGRLPDGTRLAVKKLEGGGGQGLKQFVAEIASMGSVSHINVVKLCGFCIESSQRLLVYEFMPNGSLDRWLFDPSSAPGVLSWQQRFDIALGMARGLAYLHEACREPIIHLDVKPQNILLDNKFVAKVADFGMAKLLSDRDVSQVVTCVRGTPGYLAPEWLMHSIATKKCDVYSYGMVLLELLAGRKNLDTSKMNSRTSGRASSSSSGYGSGTADLWWYFPAWAVNEVREGRILGVIDEKIRSSVSEKQATKMVRLALWCIQENASLRPGMDEVVEMLEGYRDVEEPPMSFHFAVQTTVGITASRDSVSMAYVTPPSFEVSSLIR